MSHVYFGGKGGLDKYKKLMGIEKYPKEQGVSRSKTEWKQFYKDARSKKKEIASKMKGLKPADFYEVLGRSGTGRSYYNLGYTSNARANKAYHTSQGWKGKDLVYKTKHKK